MYTTTITVESADAARVLNSLASASREVDAIERKTKGRTAKKAHTDRRAAGQIDALMGGLSAMALHRADLVQQAYRMGLSDLVEDARNGARFVVGAYVAA